VDKRSKTDAGGHSRDEDKRLFEPTHLCMCVGAGVLATAECGQTVQDAGGHSRDEEPEGARRGVHVCACLPTRLTNHVHTHTHTHIHTHTRTQIDECTFKPKVNATSAALMADRSETLHMLRMSAHEQLFQDALRRQQKWVGLCGRLSLVGCRCSRMWVLHWRMSAHEQLFQDALRRQQKWVGLCGRLSLVGAVVPGCGCCICA